METIYEPRQKQNPEQNSNLLSKITFVFSWPIFVLTRRPDFNEYAIYKPIPEFSTKTLAEKINFQWNLERMRKNPSLVKCFCRVFGYAYILLVLCIILVDVVVMLVTPNLIGKVVVYFTLNTTNNEVIYILLLVCCIFLNAIFSNYLDFAVQKVILKIKIASTALIYQKTLTLNSSSMVNGLGGQAVTLITKDLAIVDPALSMLYRLLSGVLKIAVMTYTIYIQIGVVAVLGLSVILVFIILQAMLGSVIVSYRLLTAQKSDKRLRIIQEVIATIKLIKIYTWESFFNKKIGSTRRKEVKSFQILMLIKSFAMSIGVLSGKAAFYTCIVTFVALGNKLSAEKAFIVVGCFGSLGNVLNVYIPFCFVTMAGLRAALIRINNFLKQAEATYPSQDDKCYTKKPFLKLTKFTVINANRVVLKNVNLLINPGVTIITGAVGSGKSTFLKAVLGDLKTFGNVDISGKMSYASQEPWLFPGTIKRNIIFTETFNRPRYAKVLEACALKEDLDKLPFGDETLLSDKGINLSQGQKMRINLARAVYRSADIYLLDDCFSAVDVQVGKHIFDECIKKLLYDKVVLLVSQLYSFITVSHNILYLQEGQVTSKKCTTEEVADESDCYSISKQDTYLNTRASFNNDTIYETLPLLPEHSCPSKNLYHEVTQKNSVNKKVYYNYFMAGGLTIFFAFLAVLLSKQAAESGSSYTLRFWVDAEEQLSNIKINFTNSTEYDHVKLLRNSRLIQYSVWILVGLVFLATKTLALYVFAKRTSLNIHHSLVKKILSAPMAFFDKTLSGSIVNRFSRDFNIVDELLPTTVLDSVEISLSIVSVLIMVSSTHPWFLIPTACFLLTLFLFVRWYLPSGRNIRRIEGVARSPVVGLLQTTFDGLATIRACTAEKALMDKMSEHLDVYNSILYMHLAAEKAFRFYLDILSGCYIAAVLIVLSFLREKIGPSSAGLAITQAYTLSALLQWCTFQWSELEMYMTSAERIFEYTQIKSEEETGNLLHEKISNGTITYKDVCLRYTKTGNLVLDNVSFVIEHGETVGIVGRTGAGKSSIVAALFKLYPFDGTITLGGININDIPLVELRSKISVVPQSPILYAGTIRSNIDPKGTHSDKDLWHALKQVELLHLVTDLDQATSECNGGFSCGEKQLLCLARIILENNPIIVLDEVSAHVDDRLERLIQNIVSTVFLKRTVIIIAHRLHMVINCDKVLVIDSGSVREYNHPRTLLLNKDSVFYGIVQDAGFLP